MAYIPSQHTTVSKPIGISGNATDARSRYYDATLFKYRDYVSTAEVISYLTTASHRTGGFPIFINSTGTLSNGVITGGERVEYWFKDGTTDGDLVVKSSGGSGELDATPTNGSTNGVESNGVFDALATKQDSDDDLTAIAGLTASNDDFLQRKSGAWTNRTVAQVKTDLSVNNVDNTSDATKNSATATFTNKSISGSDNTLSNIPQSAVTSLTTDLGLKAPLSSPTFTGTPVAPTAAPGTNTTQIATTAFVLANSSIITTDSVPTDGSTNPVESNGVFDALATKQDLDDDLTSIAGLSPSNDDFVQRKSGAWANRTIAQVKSDLGINNVDNTSDSTKNSATATLTNKTIDGGSNTVQNLAASAITSGTFVDARIAQSNVTQHQAALSIGQSQVTGQTFDMAITCSDVASDIVTGLKDTIYLPYAINITSTYAALTVAPAGSAFVIDIKVSGVSIYSNQLSIDSGENTSGTAAVPPLMTSTPFAVSASTKIEISVSQVGATTAGQGLKVVILGTKQ